MSILILLWGSCLSALEIAFCVLFFSWASPIFLLDFYVIGKVSEGYGVFTHPGVTVEVGFPALTLFPSLFHFLAVWEAISKPCMKTTWQ